MRAGRLLRRLWVVQLPVLSIVFSVTVTAAVGAAVLLGQAHVDAEDRIRSALIGGPVAESVLQISAQGGGDLRVQHDAVAEGMQRLLPGISYDLHRSLTAQPQSLHAHSDATESASAPRVALAAYDALEQHVELVSGRSLDTARAPEPDAVPVLLHAAAAVELGIGAGSQAILGDPEAGLPVWVAGTWLPQDPESGYWLDELELTGADEAALGPLVLREADLVDLVNRPNVRWRLVPEASELSAEQLPVLSSGLPATRARLSADPRITSSVVSVDGGLQQTIEDLDRQLQGIRAAAIAAAGLLGMVGAVTIWLVAGRLTDSRRHFTTVLSVRGATRGRLTRWAAGESLVAALPAAAVAMPLAIVVTRLLGGDGRSADVHVASVAWTVAAVAVVAIAAVVLRAFAAATAATPAARRSRLSERARGQGARAAALLAAAVSLLAVWRLAQDGSPVMTPAGGSPAIDPVTAAAPAVALLAGGLLGLAIVPVATRLAERVLTRQLGLAALWPVWQLSRHAGRFAAPVLLVAVAAGAGTVGVAYTSTWDRLQRDLAGIEVGADVRVEFPRQPVLSDMPEPRTAADFREIDDVTAAVPTSSTTVRVRDQELSVTALPAAGLAAVSAAPDSFIDAPAAGGLLAEGADHVPGLALPSGTDRIEVTVMAALEEADVPGGEVPELDDDAGEPDSESGAANPPGLVELRLWLADGDGVLGSVALDPVEATPGDEPAPQLRTALLPAGGDPWHLAAVDVILGTVDHRYRYSHGYDIAMTQLTAIGAGGRSTVDLDALGRWSADHPVNTGGEVDVRPSTVASVGASTGPHVTSRVPVRILPPEPPGPLPVVVSTDAAETLGLDVGSAVTVRAFGADVDLRVAGTTAAVPGGQEAAAAIVDLPRLSGVLLRHVRQLPSPSAVWLDVGVDSAAETVAASARDAAGPDAVVHERAARAGAADTGGAWTGAFLIAGVAVIILVVLGNAAAWTALRERRQADGEVLRALGMSPRVQVWSQVAEHAAVSAAGIAAGLFVGALIARIAIGPLAASATPGWPDRLEASGGLSWLPWLVCVALLVAALVAVALWHGARVAADVRRPPERVE